MYRSESSKIYESGSQLAYSLQACSYSIVFIYYIFHELQPLNIMKLLYFTTWKLVSTELHLANEVQHIPVFFQKHFSQLSLNSIFKTCCNSIH